MTRTWAGANPTFATAALDTSDAIASDDPVD